MFIGDKRASKTLDTLKDQRNIDGTVFTYGYGQGKFSIEVKEICRPINSFY